MLCSAEEAATPLPPKTTHTHKHTPHHAAISCVVDEERSVVGEREGSFGKQLVVALTHLAE